MARSKFGLGGLVAVTGLLASACLFSSPSALSVVRDATGRALDSDSMHFELSTSIEGDISTAEAEEFAVKGHGAFDSDAERSVFSFETNEFGIAIRQVDGFAYIRSSDEDGWTKFDADEFEGIAEAFAPLFDPHALLEELGIDPTNAKHEGSDEIRGKKAERYSLEVPTRDYDQAVDSFFRSSETRRSGSGSARTNCRTGSSSNRTTRTSATAATCSCA